ncbi:TBC1 domain family member 20 isoform X1 [Hydra vulgaris]|uniref:TBC1 domain family member 20 n=1 Tax=Hydra vulgaris TaxID=6087 RepID=T2M7E7_HYDVU|nr:TBC1 domain family member 20 [Hydra vulgaris]
MMHAVTQKKTYLQSKKKIKNKKFDVITNELYKEKVRKINEALDCDPVDIFTLRKLMFSYGGCINNDLRCKVWPKLLNVDIFNILKGKSVDDEIEEFKKNVWWNQVNLDVNRSYRRFAPNIRMSRRKVLQQKLLFVIMRVLCRNPHLHYFQGYHDIAVTLLRVLGEELASELLNVLSNTYLRDFMDKDMKRTNNLLSFFYPILSKVDKELEEFLTRSEVGTIFALSWLITWFGHDVNKIEVIVRICDIFLAGHPILPIYFAVTVVVSHRSMILKRDCEMAMVHQCLSKLPFSMSVDDVEKFISDSLVFFKRHPPDSLSKDIIYHMKQSDSIALHSDLLERSQAQRPDRVLRKRKRMGKLLCENSLPILSVATTEELNANQSNLLVKAAVWTMTISMGVMTFLVLNTGKWV